MGERGEICIRGPQVMAGYWQRPDETAKVMTDDGFFKSGDIGVMDAQRLREDRRPQEGHDPGQRFQRLPQRDRGRRLDAARRARGRRIGVPDDKSGEAVKLFVVRSDPALSLEAVQAHCRDNLTGYKNPKHIEFADALPKSTVGKILRRELRG